MMKSMTAAVIAVRVVFFAITLLTPVSVCPANSADEKADRLFDLAGQAQNDGEFEFAVDRWEKFLADHKDDPRAAKAQHYAGVCRMTLKQYAKAVKAFSQVIDRQDADKLSQLEESYYYLGWCQYSIGQQGTKNNSSLESAIKTFDQHIAKFKKGKFLDQAVFLKAESLYFLGKKKESIAVYSIVVNDYKKSTSRPDAIYALGVSQFETQQYDPAGKTFDLFLSEFKEHQLLDDVRLFKAESVLQRGLLVAKKDKAAAQNLFASSMTQLKSLAEKDAFAKRDDALFKQAICQFHLGNPQEAAKLYAQVATDFKNSRFAKSAQFQAGKLYLQINDHPNAQKWFQQVAAGDPDNADAANHWLCRSLFREEKFQDAASLAETSIQAAKNKDFLVKLKMVRAEALEKIPETGKSSIERYKSIAEEHSSHPLAPQALYYAAFACLEFKEYATGLELTKSFITRHEKDTFLPEVKYIRGECFLFTDKKEEAEQVYKDLVENHSSEKSIHSWRIRYGLTLYLQDKYKEAVAFLDPVLAQLKNPGNQAEANFLIGASQFYQDEFAKSITNLEVAVGFGKQLKQVDEGLILLAQSYDKQKMAGKAISTLDMLLTGHPGSRYIPQANYLSGQYLADQKHFAKAIKKFDAVLAIDKNKYSPYALYGKGWALLNQGKENPEKNKAAKLDFTALINSHDGHVLIPDAFYSRAVAHRRTREYQKAIKDIDQCLGKKPDFQKLVSALYEKGMAQSAAKEFAGAITTFERLTADFKSNKDAEEFLYQLAWAYKSGKKESQAVESFRKLVKTFPNSPSVAEAHYHVAEDLYKKNDFDAAITEYEAAAQKSSSTEVAEKSRYKLAWSHYQKKDFANAQEAFQAQVTAFAKGDYTDSGKFMVAECLYHQEKFKEANDEFTKIRDVVLGSQKTNASEKALACLHGAEVANKLRNYEQAIEFIKVLQDDLKDMTYVAETLLELGNSYRGQKMFAQAMTAFSGAYDQSKGETGARAGFLVGELLFEQKKFPDAIEQYKLVIYGFGGTRAQPAIKKWQCSSAYETARCYHVQIKSEPDNEKKSKLISDAQKFYNYVLKNNPQDRLAADSRKQIELLSKIK